MLQEREEVFTNAEPGQVRSAWFVGRGALDRRFCAFHTRNSTLNARHSTWKRSGQDALTQEMF